MSAVINRLGPIGPPCQLAVVVTGDALLAPRVQLARLPFAWLMAPEIIRLQPSDERHAIPRRDGTFVATRSGEPIYTTRTMRRLETDVVATFEHGHNTVAAFVAPEIVDAAIAANPSIGDDQAGLARAMCIWPDQYQCAVGPAGSGKTYALNIANRAWTDAGYNVVGAAVNATPPISCSEPPGSRRVPWRGGSPGSTARHLTNPSLTSARCL